MIRRLERLVRADYGDDVCARTLSILRRSVFVSMDPDWDETAVAQKREALMGAAGQV